MTCVPGGAAVLFTRQAFSHTCCAVAAPQLLALPDACLLVLVLVLVLAWTVKPQPLIHHQ